MSLQFNTIPYLASRPDKPLIFHASLYIFTDELDTYSLYFTYDDVNFYYVQNAEGRRKIYKTLDDAYLDVCRVDLENGVMLVTSQHSLVDVENFDGLAGNLERRLRGLPEG